MAKDPAFEEVSLPLFSQSSAKAAVRGKQPSTSAIIAPVSGNASWMVGQLQFRTMNSWN